MIAFLRWWLMVCVFIISAVILQQFGMFSALWEADISKISFILITMFTTVSSYIGFMTYKQFKEMNVSEREVHICWWFADESQTLGLIGTVIGFLIMLTMAFVNLDIENTKSIEDAIKFISIGMGTALVTTLVGMLSSLLLKAQLMNMDNDKQNKN